MFKRFAQSSLLAGGLLCLIVTTSMALQAALPAFRALADDAGQEEDGTTQAVTTTLTITRTPRLVDETSPPGLNAPVETDSEIGSDFRLSSMGPDGNTSYYASTPAVAYNDTNHQYLVVWAGSDDVIDEIEIWGQRVNANTGAQIGADFQISFVGIADDPNYDAVNPDIAYNSHANEYLVVWSADHFADGDCEIFGQRLNASTGALVGSMVRLSVMGSGVDPDYDAYRPAVAYNSQDNEYLIVWEGDDDTAPLLNDEYEIWGQLLRGNGELIGSNFLISDMGGYGNAGYDAYQSDVAYNSRDNQYMVVWSGDDNFFGISNDELEIWGQRLNASGGAMGASDFRISTAGPDDNPNHDAIQPAIAYNDRFNEYLVVWAGDDAINDLFDIFAQRLQANGVQVGTDDFQVNHALDGPNAYYIALDPAVAYDRGNNEYLVVWVDDELGANELEIWGKRLDAVNGTYIGGLYDTRLSDMGVEGNSMFDAFSPALAYTKDSHNQYLVTWYGDDTTDDEFEIWAQRFNSGFKLFLPVMQLR